MTAGVTAASLTCIRGGRKLFDGLDFSLGEGRVLAIGGANGAGKTSLLRLIAGLLEPSAGQVRIESDGAVAEEPEARRRLIGWLGVEEALKPQVPLGAQLRFHAALMGGGEVEAALARCGLEAVANRPARALSAGQRRRAGLARLMLRMRPVWLLDEPLLSLDEGGRALAREAVDAHCRGGGVALVAGHDPLGLPCATLTLEGGCARFSP